MFLKRISIRKNGKGHTYGALVKSVRTARGWRHQVVSYLGELEPGEKAGWAQVGRITRRPHPARLTLFDDTDVSDPVPEKVEVLVRRARVDRTRDFGDVYLGLLLWQTLQLDKLLDRRIERGRSCTPWPLMATVSTPARFCEPSSELHLRPIWHHREDRVQAHILLSFLAYAMWKTLEQWMERSGLGSGPRTVIEEFQRIKSTDVVLPTSTGREVRIRCITTPDEAQRILLDRLGVQLPTRLGEPKWDVGDTGCSQ